MLHLAQQSKERAIITFDLETDPFVRDRLPEAFLAGIWDGRKYTYFWGDDCIDSMMRYLASIPPAIIYIHNGGRFDVYHFIHYILGHEMKIINNRIVVCKIRASGGYHEIRDSYAIIPEKLANYKKDDIDYNWMEKKVRNKHKDVIIDYHKNDCVYLHELVTGFRKTFGDKLTIGSAAMTQLKKTQKFDILSDSQSDYIRQNYYYGGRTEKFVTGHVTGNFRVYDVNSMYPYVMRNFRHPISSSYYIDNKISDDTFFVSVKGFSRGAFPERIKNEGLRFYHRHSTYHVSIYEYQAAIECGMFDCDEIVQTVNFTLSCTFEPFVDKFYGMRMEAKQNGDKLGSLFYKLILNSSYGKFAQNPEEYFDYRLTNSEVNLIDQGWEPISLDEVSEVEGYIFWRRRPETPGTYYNVATGASITGAARSVLLRGLHKAKRAIYCDTDSIICESLDCFIDENRLGAWKVEGAVTDAYIVARKTYLLENAGQIVKVKSKGAHITADEMKRVCAGETVEWLKESPTYSLKNLPRFLKREVKLV